MPHGAKIATCCYCGTRAALTLQGKERHELACASCGAPLHDLKGLPRASVSESPKRQKNPRKPKAKRSRKRKSLSQKFLSEAFDFIEDILD